MWVLYTFGGSHVSFNQSKRVCWKVCVRRYVASISHILLVYEIKRYINLCPYDTSLRSLKWKLKINFIRGCLNGGIF